MLANLASNPNPLDLHFNLATVLVIIEEIEVDSREEAATTKVK